MSKEELKILGIDPGFRRLGFGIINAIIDGTNYTCKLVSLGLIKTSQDNDYYTRLTSIYNNLENVILSHKPDIIVVESIFSFGRRNSVMTKIAQVQGLIYALAIQNKLTIIEINPITVKKLITKNARADKQVVKDILLQMLNIQNNIQIPYDLFDALAVAMSYLLKYKCNTNEK